MNKLEQYIVNNLIRIFNAGEAIKIIDIPLVYFHRFIAKIYVDKNVFPDKTCRFHKISDALIAVLPNYKVENIMILRVEWYNCTKYHNYINLECHRTITRWTKFIEPILFENIDDLDKQLNNVRKLLPYLNITQISKAWTQDNIKTEAMCYVPHEDNLDKYTDILNDIDEIVPVKICSDNNTRGTFFMLDNGDITIDVEFEMK